MLAELLSPTGDHAQGTLFLRHFLAMCQSRHPSFPLPTRPLEGTSWRVETEKVTSHGNLDIVIACHLSTRGNLGDPNGRAWDEISAVDQYGHQHGWQIAHHVRGEVERILDRVRMFFDHGWREIAIVTDHGRLMLPGGLPKAEIPAHLTVQPKGRCAVLKTDVQVQHQTVPWHWNKNVRIAIAPYICCFEAGKEYEHGGISPQECVVPLLRVSSPD